MLLDRYLEYIDNAGGSPTVGQFDEDWEPIGPSVRARLRAAELIHYEHKDDAKDTLIRRTTNAS